MLLLNAVRAMLITLGLLILTALHLAYDLQGLSLLLVFGVITMVVLTTADLSEQALIRAFNPDDSEA